MVSWTNTTRLQKRTGVNCAAEFGGTVGVRVAEGEFIERGVPWPCVIGFKLCCT